MEKYVFEGKTEEEVILNALNELGVKEDELITKIKEETTGLLKKKKYVMEVIKKSDCEVVTRQEKLQICMTYTSDYSENIDAYVNLGHTDSGAHIQAFHTAFVRAVNKYATDVGLLKKNDRNFNNAEIA